MTDCLACLTVWGSGTVLLIGLVTLRAALRRSGAPLQYRVGYDATHPRPDVAMRRVPPVVPPPDARYARICGPATIEVARPEGPLGWDAQPRKEY